MFEKIIKACLIIVVGNLKIYKFEIKLILLTIFSKM